MKLKISQVTQLLFFCLLSGGASSTNAAVTANAKGMARLSIIDIVNTTSSGDLSGLSLSAESEIPFVFVDSFGNANITTSSTATPTAPTFFEAGDELKQSSELTAQIASAGFFQGSILTESFIDIFNNSSTDSFEILFSLDYSLSVFTSLADMVLESADAVAQVTLLDDTFTIDIDELIYADALSGSSSLLVDTVNFGLTIEPDSSNQLFLALNLVSSAESFRQAVPEPNVLWLMILGVSAYCLSKSTRNGSSMRAVSLNSDYVENIG